MLKILQARLQQYVNWEIPDVQAGYRRGRRTGNQIAKIPWIIKKAREFEEKTNKQTTSISVLLTMPKLLTVWITTNYGKFLKAGDYQTTLPDSWKICMQVKKQQLEPNMEQQTVHIGKGVCQDCILSPCLFNLYAQYIMWNARQDEAQAGIKIARSNTNNLRYTDDTIVMAESEEELKSLLIKVKEENKKLKWRSWHPILSLHGK